MTSHATVSQRPKRTRAIPPHAPLARRVIGNGHGLFGTLSLQSLQGRLLLTVAGAGELPTIAMPSSISLQDHLCWVREDPPVAHHGLGSAVKISPARPFGGHQRSSFRRIHRHIPLSSSATQAFGQMFRRMSDRHSQVQCTPVHTSRAVSQRPPGTRLDIAHLRATGCGTKSECLNYLRPD